MISCSEPIQSPQLVQREENLSFDRLLLEILPNLLIRRVRNQFILKIGVSPSLSPEVDIVHSRRGQIHRNSV